MTRHKRQPGSPAGLLPGLMVDFAAPYQQLVVYLLHFRNLNSRDYLPIKYLPVRPFSKQRIIPPRSLWIAGAAVDVIEEEPGKQRNRKPDNPLFTLPNFVVTPHAAYYSEDAMRTVRDFAAREVVRVLTGQPPLSPVNANQLASTDRA